MRVKTPGVITGFAELIDRVPSPNGEKGKLGHFKRYFSAAGGMAYYSSSSANWAKMDLDTDMQAAAQNAPVFIEAFYDACEALRKAGIAAPGVARINRVLAENDAGYEIAPLNLIARNPHQNQPQHHHHHHHHHHQHDHNLRSAYLHVLVDALTSVFAIVALLAGKYLGAVWLDPFMGVVGAVLVARWACYLLRDTSHILLDHRADEHVRRHVRQAIEGDTDNRLADLHVWPVGPGIYAAALSIVTHEPREPEHYRALLPADLGIVHSTIEVHQCREAAAA